MSLRISEFSTTNQTFLSYHCGILHFVNPKPSWQPTLWIQTKTMQRQPQVDTNINQPRVQLKNSTLYVKNYQTCSEKNMSKKNRRCKLRTMRLQSSHGASEPLGYLQSWIIQNVAFFAAQRFSWQGVGHLTGHLDSMKRLNQNMKNLRSRLNVKNWPSACNASHSQKYNTPVMSRHPAKNKLRDVQHQMPKRPQPTTQVSCS